jgi:hypothetical protein
MGGTCSTDGRDEECIKYLIGKPEEKTPLGRPRHRWKIVDWIRLAQDRDQ